MRSILGKMHTGEEPIRRWQSASPYEAKVGFCRALRTADRILLAGTAPIGPGGKTVSPGDAQGQAMRCFEILDEALGQLGGHRSDIVRTRVFLTRRSDWEAVARAHGQVFGEIRPVATFVVVRELLDPDWLLEIEAEAIVTACVPGGAVRIEPASEQAVRRVWTDRWGVPIITPSKRYSVEDVEGLVLFRGGELAALVTWCISGRSAEIVSLDALVEGAGYGSRLLGFAERHLADRGVRRVHLVTSNDNVRAFGFYIHRGYRLRRVHLDALESAREIKPGIPELGSDGIRLRDLWELEKDCSEDGDACE
ncbi:MAG: GNAT family N-acetyltransferase [Deltaproteobacteria bacterium]|nr:GNAT family N-acetyltransferase [Deltaproteobacteria bacterium]